MEVEDSSFNTDMDFHQLPQFMLQKNTCVVHFLGHFLVPLVAMVCCVSAFLCLQLHIVDSYRSAGWDPSVSNDAIPYHFVQISDIHTTHVYPEIAKQNVLRFRNISEWINPKAVLVTGDLVDSSHSRNILAFHYQTKENWDDYNYSRANSGLFKDRLIVEAAGNHDLMVVPIDNMEHNFFRRYTMTETEPFDVRKFTVEQSGQRPIAFVRFNPLRPPMTSGPLGMFPWIARSVIDNLEAALKSDATNVIVTHFPYYSTFGRRSSSGKTKTEVFQRAHLFVSGHIHHIWHECARFGSVLAVVMRALQQYPVFTLYSIDRNQIRQREMAMPSGNNILVTYPIPKAQITNNVVFNETTFEVRLLLFGAETATVSIDEESPIPCACTEIAKNVRFCRTDNVTVTTGSHRIRATASGCSDKFKFYVGQKVGRKLEKASVFMRASVLYGTPIACFILIMLMLIPWWRIPQLAHGIHLFDLLINYDIPKLSLPMQILWGPLYGLSRNRRVPRRIHLWEVFLLLAFFIFPMYFMWIKNYLAIAWPYGLHAVGTFRPHPMLGFLWLTYLFFFLLPHVAMYQVWFEVDTFSTRHRVEFAVLLTTNILFIVYWCIIMTLAGSWFAVITSPVLYTVIISLGVAFATFRRHNHNHPSPDYIGVSGTEL